MADAPQYERTTPIKPQQAVQGFDKAASQFGAFASNIAKMGADLAQESANKYAQMQGVEAAQKSLATGKPNLSVMLPLTEADKNFANAYKSELGQELSYQGQKSIQDLQMIAIRNPTNDSLANFEDLSKRSIEDIVSRAPQESRGPLRRSLEESYLAARNRMVLQLDKSNREYMLSKQRVQDDQQGKLITNSNLEGNVQAAIQAYDDRLETIAQRERIYTNTGGQEGYDPAQAELERQLAKNKLEVSGLQYGFVQALKDQKGSEYLKELRENRPEGMTPSEHDQAVKAVLSYGADYQAALQAQQNINYLKYATMVDTGKMTESDLIQARKDISEGQFAQLERYIATRTTEAGKMTQLYNDASPHFDDAGYMSRYTGKQVDAIFQKHVELYNNAVSEQTGEPHEATLGEKALLAQPINAPIPAIQKEMSRSANYGTPAQALEAVRGMVMLNRNNNGVTLDGLSDHDKAILNTFKDLSANASYSPEEALKLARDTTNVDENTKQSRLDGWKDWRKTQGWNESYNKKLSHIVDGIGAKTGVVFKNAGRVPSGIDVSYDRMMQRLVPLYPNPQDAETEVFAQMSKVIQRTNINADPTDDSGSKDEWMRFAPTQVLAGTPGYFKYNDRLRALKEVVDRNKQAQAEGKFVMNTLDWPDAPDLSDLVSKPLAKKPPTILVNGKPYKAVVESDDTTQWNIELGPSWGLSYEDESGQRFPIVDFEQGFQARWIPDFKYLDSLRKSPEDIQREAIEKAHSQKLKGEEDERIKSEVGQYSTTIGGLV